MKNKYLIVALMLMIVVISGCSSNSNESQENNQNTIKTEQKENNQNKIETEQKEIITMDKIYNYEIIKDFEYKITTTTSEISTSTNIKYALDSDTINGKAAWVSSAEINAEGTKVLAKTWTDKTTFECLKIANVITFNNQEMETKIDCPKTGPNAVSNGEIPKLTYTGTESITTPLGTYNAKKYSLDTMITYWYVESIPIPIKVTYTSSETDLDALTVMELVDWN